MLPWSSRVITNDATSDCKTGRMTDRRMLRIRRSETKQLDTNSKSNPYRDIRIDVDAKIVNRADWCRLYTTDEFGSRCWRRHQSNSILAAFSCSRLARIHDATSPTHSDTCTATQLQHSACRNRIVACRRHMNSDADHGLRTGPPCTRRIESGPRTDPCGTALHV